MPSKQSVSREFARILISTELLCAPIYSLRDTLRTNEYGLRASSGSVGHPLADAFASFESLSTSASHMVFVTYNAIRPRFQHQLPSNNLTLPRPQGGLF